VESYTLLDFSEYFLELSRQRLRSFPRICFAKANFKTEDWYQQLAAPYTAVLAMQSIHEIRHKRHVPGLYARIRSLLEPGGLLAVCDGTPRDTTALWQVSLFMTVAEQLNAFASAGFSEVKLEAQKDAMILVTGRA
jgi:hypothetical protein